MKTTLWERKQGGQAQQIQRVNANSPKHNSPNKQLAKIKLANFIRVVFDILPTFTLTGYNGTVDNSPLSHSRGIIELWTTYHFSTELPSRNDYK